MGLKDRFENANLEEEEYWRKAFADGELTQAARDRLLIPLEEHFRREAEFLSSLDVRVHRSAQYVHLSTPSTRSIIRISPCQDKAIWCIEASWTTLETALDEEECIDQVGKLLADNRTWQVQQ